MAAIAPDVGYGGSGESASQDPTNATEVAMARPSHRDSKLLRFTGIAAALALVAALAGCVIYPAGPGYYHPFYFHFDHDHDRGWH